MPAGNASERKARLARALKQNLRRRKEKTDPADAEGGLQDSPPEGDGLGPGAGIAPQDGLKLLPSHSPKTASKRL